VTYQAVAPLLRIDQEDAERLVASVYHVKAGDYAFFLGAIEPKKNLKRLIEAHLLAGIDIVTNGSGDVKRLKGHGGGCRLREGELARYLHRRRQIDHRDCRRQPQGNL
jgi:hypothetical protein